MASAPPGAGSQNMGWIAPAISGAATLGGAALGGKAAKDAAKTQAQTTDKTLAFTREQEAQRKAVYDQKMQQWTASRNALLQRYGIDIAPPSLGGAPAAPQGPPGAVPRPALQPGPSGVPTGPQGVQGGNLASLIQPQQQAPQGMPDLESWKRPNYGLPQA